MMVVVVMAALIMVPVMIRCNIIDFMSGNCCVGSGGVITFDFCNNLSCVKI